MQDLPFEIGFTYEFIKRSLPPDCAGILEVGCGTGELASRLSQDGFTVVAIDSDKESVTAARARGVDARVAEWPHFREGQFDAVLFTRSLHHIHPLDNAVQAAAACLANAGRIIVEDFAYESPDERTLRWFTSVSRIFDASPLLVERDEILEEILKGTSSLSAWRKHHNRDLHTAAEIEAVLKDVFDKVIVENVPYYFRYLAKAMPLGLERDAIVQALAQQEATVIADGSIVPLGRRFIATSPEQN